MSMWFTRIALLLAYLLLAGCDDRCPLTVCFDPPNQSAGGVWIGQSITAAEPDVFTTFDINAAGPFSVGASPFTATFSNGNADSGFWRVLVGTSATVTFETLPSSVSFTATSGFISNVAEIRILDENSDLIQRIVPNDIVQEAAVNREPGETLIGSVEVISTSGDDVVFHDFTFGFAESTDAIRCVLAITDEIACTIIDATSNIVIASAQGTVQISNGNEVSGSGSLYATPDFQLNDGSTSAVFTISGGMVDESNILDLTVDAVGRTSTISTTFDDIYDRGSDLGTIAAVYTTYDIFGDPSSFAIDPTGAISGQSNAGCVLDGQVTIIDAAFNAYDITLDVANCGGLDGIYDGLGTTQDIAAMDDLFIFAVFTAQTTIVGAAEK